MLPRDETFKIPMDSLMSKCLEFSVSEVFATGGMKILNSINPKDKDVKLKGPHITKSRAVCSRQSLLCNELISNSNVLLTAFLEF